MSRHYPKITEAIRQRGDTTLPNRIRILSKPDALAATELNIVARPGAGPDEQWVYDHAHVVLKLPVPTAYAGSALETEINRLDAIAALNPIGDHRKIITNPLGTYIILDEWAAKQLTGEMVADPDASDDEKRSAKIIENGGTAPIHARAATAADVTRAATPSTASAGAGSNLLCGNAIEKITALAARNTNWTITENTPNKVTIHVNNSDNKVIVENHVIRMSSTPESYKAAAEIAKELIANSQATAGAKPIHGLKLAHTSNNPDALAEMANAYLDAGIKVYIDPSHLLDQVKDKVKTVHKAKLQETHDELRDKLAQTPPSSPMTSAASGGLTPPASSDSSGPTPRTI